jgi:hypothetical protein
MVQILTEEEFRQKTQNDLDEFYKKLKDYQLTTQDYLYLRVCMDNVIESIKTTHRVVLSTGIIISGSSLLSLLKAFGVI